MESEKPKKLILGVSKLPDDLEERVGKPAKTHREGVWSYECDGKLSNGEAGAEYSGDIFWYRLKCEDCGAIVKSVEGQIHWWNSHTLTDGKDYKLELAKFNGEVGVYARELPE